MAAEDGLVAVEAAAVTGVAMAAPGLQLAVLDGGHQLTAAVVGVGLGLDRVQPPLAQADEAREHGAGSLVHF